MKQYIFRVRDTLLIEYLEWEGAGYYASKQRSAHERQQIITRCVGDGSDDYNELSNQLYKNGWITLMWLDEPYGQATE